VDARFFDFFPVNLFSYLWKSGVVSLIFRLEWKTWRVRAMVLINGNDGNREFKREISKTFVGVYGRLFVFSVKGSARMIVAKV
jgi:hypothetical protein